MTTAAPTTAGPDLADLVARLDLETKVGLLTGVTAWRLRAVEEIGLRSLVMSDGPAGVRGTGEDPSETSVSLPSPTALAATWDLDLARRVGALFAAEARRHGVDVVLAPQVNIQRTPVAGRHFECYSEDPLLTSSMGGAVVRGMQDGGVAACLKHFVANDSETDRTTYLATVDERTLREVYLAPFEHAVREVGVWSVMAAYNQVDDGVLAAPATEHTRLLRDVLKDEWGFDGVVVSDWMAARRTVEAANGGLDVVMPGPGGPWEQRLVAAVRAGEVPEREIDDKVARVLRLARRTGALDLPPRPVPVAHPDLPRELAAQATVVLRDAGAQLPLDPSALRTVLLVGPNAVDAFVQGGGSAHVTPDHVVTPGDGLRAALPDADVTVLRGGAARRHAPELDLARCADPGTGAPGIRVTRLGRGGVELGTSVVTSWDGWDRDPGPGVEDVRVEAVVRLPEPGDHLLEVGTVGRHRVLADGVLVTADDRPVGAEVVLDSSINSPDGCPITVVGPAEVRLTATAQVVSSGFGSAARAALRHRRPDEDVDAEIAAAVEAAATVDSGAVVVVVGTNDEVESEGWDRTSLALPGRQDELVERILDVAPDAVVVVNAGAPVLLPWLDRARTVLWTWFPGQDCGQALADVLLGVTEPAGRLPWTLPARDADVPVPDAVPVHGVVAYDEGVHVGYRGWLRAGTRPAAPFGHGLGWTTWEHRDVAVGRSDGGLDVTVRVANTGERSGSEVVQVYLEPPAGPHGDRPVRWLGGFARIGLAPGTERDVVVRVPERALQVWDVAAHAWRTPPGDYRVLTGRSVADVRLVTTVHLDHEEVGRG
ncbi:glycoside hydrolase family 3 C-terminal domain-containing protein [Actinotalea sp. M2MS4P-6]|uniref:beta-glucosidase family protein n=1 Tax=Actinotalea sp. M2MS4P-6 TaxID=2983762 RepID=UPI0021E3B025|nr:glycoside hydrolase family 3 N-terminal domain-containing protein [Actinotalea sp. M2MS4P-6]MCV2393529.1 glycoside hydrolase family 3 C-terminal domain-containing protein [Actinotalea sp. M2MS4P-6]